MASSGKLALGDHVVHSSGAPPNGSAGAVKDDLQVITWKAFALNLRRSGFAQLQAFYWVKLCWAAQDRWRNRSFPDKSPHVERHLLRAVPSLVMRVRFEMLDWDSLG